MKQVFAVVLTSAIVLTIGTSLLYQTTEPPPAASVSMRVSHSEPGASAPGRHASAEMEVERVSAAEMQQQEMAMLKEQVALLKGEVSTLQRQIHERWQAAAVAAPRNEEDLDADPRTDPATRAEAERVRQEQMKIVEASFRQEPTNRLWSFEAAGAVHDALANTDIGLTALRSLECRSSTCRVEFIDDDTGELEEVLPILLQQVSQTLPNGTANHVEDGAGGQSIVLYLSRE